ncbi:MAG: hypothetical protein JWM91_2147 [Rhodospirillales bacterium]|nr:hypothetical protein [Rhodospirillales bacterium]
MAWLTTAIRLAPHALKLGEIAVSALPHLTHRKRAVMPEIPEPPMLPEIIELQSAATQNAKDIRKIAEDLKDALIAIENGGRTMESRFRRLELVSYAALGLSVLAIALTLALWLR